MPIFFIDQCKKENVCRGTNGASFQKQTRGDLFGKVEL